MMAPRGLLESRLTALQLQFAVSQATINRAAILLCGRSLRLQHTQGDENIFRPDYPDTSTEGANYRAD